MTGLTDEAVKALLTENKFVVEGSFNHTINRLAYALLEARADNARLRADAQAAVAMVLEKAVQHIVSEGERLAEGMQQTDPALAFLRELAAEVLAMVDTDGLAMVEALRKERDDANAALDSYRSATDGMQADNAAAQAQIEALRDFVDDFAKARIDALRYSPPYGSSPEDEPDPVVEAETVWAWQADAKAALAALPAKEGE